MIISPAHPTDHLLSRQEQRSVFNPPTCFLLGVTLTFPLVPVRLTSQSSHSTTETPSSMYVSAIIYFGTHSACLLQPMQRVWWNTVRAVLWPQGHTFSYSRHQPTYLIVFFFFVVFAFICMLLNNIWTHYKSFLLIIILSPVAGKISLKQDQFYLRSKRCVFSECDFFFLNPLEFSFLV